MSSFIYLFTFLYIFTYSFFVSISNGNNGHERSHNTQLPFSSPSSVLRPIHSLSKGRKIEAWMTDGATVLFFPLVHLIYNSFHSFLWLFFSPCVVVDMLAPLFSLALACISFKFFSLGSFEYMSVLLFASLSPWLFLFLALYEV